MKRDKNEGYVMDVDANADEEMDTDMNMDEDVDKDEGNGTHKNENTDKNAKMDRRLIGRRSEADRIRTGYGRKHGLGNGHHGPEI